MISVWNNVTALTSQQGKSQDADIKLSYWELDHGDGLAFGGPGHIMAHAFLPNPKTLRTIHFNKGEHWSTSYNMFNQFLVAIDEMSHSFLGSMVVH